MLIIARKHTGQNKTQIIEFKVKLGAYGEIIGLRISGKSLPDNYRQFLLVVT